MSNIETIDAELRLLWRAWRVARDMCCAPNTAFIDALLDERASRLAIPDRGCDRPPKHPAVMGTKLRCETARTRV